MANTPEADENEENSGDREKSCDLSTVEEDTTSTSVILTSAKPGKSEYSRRRDANIEENKRLLSEMGLLKLSSSLNEPNKATKKKVKKGGKERKDVHTVTGRAR